MSGRFVQMVEDWRPDYVFFTIVERSARDSILSSYPPMIIIPKRDDFKPILTSSVAGINNLTKGLSEGEYQISGLDPYLDFSISSQVVSSEARFLNIDLTCDDGSPSVPLQIFWLQSGVSSYDEENSARVLFPTGQSSIDIKTIPKLSTATIQKIRLDVDAQGACTRFKLKSLEIGTQAANHREL